MPGLAAGLALRPTSFLVQPLLFFFFFCFFANMQRTGQRKCHERESENGKCGTVESKMKWSNA